MGVAFMRWVAVVVRQRRAGEDGVHVEVLQWPEPGGSWQRSIARVSARLFDVLLYIDTAGTNPDPIPDRQGLLHRICLPMYVRA